MESSFVCQNTKCPHNLWYSKITAPYIQKNQAAKPWIMNITPKAKMSHGCCLTESMGEERWSLEEIAQLYGLSRERVRQIQDTALSKITKYVFPELKTIHTEGIYMQEWRARTIKLLSGKWIQADGIMAGSHKSYRNSF